MLKICAKRRVNAKGKLYYTILGPDPKTGKEISLATIKGEDVKKRADAKIKELTVQFFENDTEFGRRESRTVGMLAAAYFADHMQRHADTREQKAWHEEWAFKSSSLRNFRDSLNRFILPELEDVVLIVLEFDDCQNFVERLKLRQPLCPSKKTSSSCVRRAGENLKAMLRWGSKRGWAIKPQTLVLLRDLRLPKKAVRDVVASDEHVLLLLATAYGPKTRPKSTWLGHLYKRMQLELILWTNGARELELANIRGRDIDRANGYIYISGSWDRLEGEDGGTKTPAGMRGRPMPDPARYTLEEIWERRGGIKDDELLFQPQRGPRNGKPCKTCHASLSHWWNELCEDAGLMIPNPRGTIIKRGAKAKIGQPRMLPMYRAQDFRRQHNSIAYREGVSSKARMLSMGHASEQINNSVYTKLIPGSRDEMAEAMARVSQQFMARLPAPQPVGPVPRHQQEGRKAYMQKYQREYKAKYRLSKKLAARTNGQIADKNKNGD